MKGVYIQDVATSDGLSLITPPEQRQEMLEKGVVIADNYVEVCMGRSYYS